jgi:hypothetical protein
MEGAYNSELYPNKPAKSTYRGTEQEDYCKRDNKDEHQKSCASGTNLSGSTQSSAKPKQQA